MPGSTTELPPKQYVERCLSDAEAEISRHLAAVGTDPDEARRATDGAPGSIYKALFKLPGYWEQAESSIDGRTMQAVIYLVAPSMLRSNIMRCPPADPGSERRAHR